MKRNIWSATVLLALTATGFSQTITTGEITGATIDSSGAVVIAAFVFMFLHLSDALPQ